MVALAVPKTFLKPCGDLMGQSRSRVGEVLSVYQAGLLCLLMEISASSDLQLMKSSTELFQRCGHWRSQSSGQQGRGSQLCWGGGGGGEGPPTLHFTCLSWFRLACPICSLPVDECGAVSAAYGPHLHHVFLGPEGLKGLQQQEQLLAWKKRMEKRKPGQPSTEGRWIRPLGHRVQDWPPQAMLFHTL